MKTVFKIVDVCKKNLKLDWDSVICIVGGEGVGKSNLMLHLLEYYNPNCKIEDIGLNTRGFINSISKSKQYGNPVFDEAGDGLYSREAMGSFNKALNKLFMAIRGKNLFTILVLPDFFDLDSYFRKKRVKGLFEVYGKGKVKFFNKKQIDIINFKCDRFKKIYGVKPSIYDTFPKYKGKLAEDYAELKKEKIKEAIDNLKGDGGEVGDRKSVV